MAITTLGQDVFWTTWESNYLYWSNKYFGDAKVKRVLLGEFLNFYKIILVSCFTKVFLSDVGERVEVIKLAALKEVRSIPEHECHYNNAGCSHLCLLQRKKPVCRHSENFKFIILSLMLILFTGLWMPRQYDLGKGWKDLFSYITL